jgi:hypothetical protein
VIEAPEGFVLDHRPDGIVVFAREIVAAAQITGLDRPWEKVRARPAGPGTGRGPRALVSPPGGPLLLVKQHLRGGFLARFNRERYFSVGRFLQEMAVGRQARTAGLRVGESLGLVLVRARPGWRSWGIVRAIEQGRDLPAWVLDKAAGGDAAALWGATLRLLDELHEAGLEHRDFNVGNVVARRSPSGVWEVFAVDLDRARWWGCPLSPGRRRRVRIRLTRSWMKVFGEPPPPPVS